MGATSSIVSLAVSYLLNRVWKRFVAACLDLVVLGQIAAGLFGAELQGNTRGVHAKYDRERTYSAFRFHGQPICLKMFRFLHTIGTKRYSNLLKHYRSHGVSSRVHGNEKSQLWNAAVYADKERAITFIKSYADVHAMPLPGKLPKHQDYKVMLLPSNVARLHEYCTASQELTNPEGGQIQIFGYCEFCRLWAKVIPYIAVMLPASDLCLTCQENTNVIMRSANLLWFASHDGIEHLMFNQLHDCWTYKVWTRLVFWRKTRVSSMHLIASVVKDSTVDGQNEAFPVGQDEPPLFYYDWHKYFSSFLTAIPNITSYHHFSFHADHPGTCSDSKNVL